MSSPVAVVVGGSSGIGLASARRFQTLGAEVHVVGRSKERLDGVVGTDPGLLAHRADGADREEIARVLDAIGRIDWLVVTLSGSEGPGALAELDLDMLRRAFDAKFWGHITTVQAALPHLNQRGSVTLLGAITARSGMPGTAGIAAINGAVEALVKPLSVELAPVRVNGVSPGFVDTPWWSGLPEEVRQGLFDQAAQLLPARGIATADDIAEVVVLAATNANITGTVIEADGGARLVSLS
jgi:NAD(P)-dependent dehydrogenase (short-subunit alcohol dehydrogenase family)